MDHLYIGAGQLAEQTGYQNAKMAQMPTMKQRLEYAVQEAETRLAKAKRARELFDKNPDLEELMNILQSGGF